MSGIVKYIDPSKIGHGEVIMNENYDSLTEQIRNDNERIKQHYSFLI